MLDGYKRYILGFLVTLGAVYFSQQSNSMEFGRSLFTIDTTKPSSAIANSKNFVAGASSWLSEKVAGEVAKRGDIIKDELAQEKQKVKENILQRVEKYFDGIGNSILGKNEPQNCPPAQ